jgi:hypothetical protein
MMCWKQIAKMMDDETVSVAGCLGYDVLGCSNAKVAHTSTS